MDNELYPYSPIVEREPIRCVVQTIEKATGRRLRGWMGPGLTETFRTPALLSPSSG